MNTSKLRIKYSKINNYPNIKYAKAYSVTTNNCYKATKSKNPNGRVVWVLFDLSNGTCARTGAKWCYVWVAKNIKEANALYWTHFARSNYAKLSRPKKYYWPKTSQ